MYHIGSCKRCEWIIHRAKPWTLPEHCPKCRSGNLVYVACDAIDRQLAEEYLGKPIPAVELAIKHPAPDKQPRKSKA